MQANEDQRIQSTPASRMQDVALTMVEKVTSQMPTFQVQMIRPMLNSYLKSLTQALTNENALEMCATVREWLEYVEDGCDEDEGGELVQI